jgi:hypothetical protein
MTKNILIIFLSLIIVIAIFKINSYRNEKKHYENFILNKMKKTKLRMTADEVNNTLGKPDTIFYYAPPLESGEYKTLSYETGIPGYSTCAFGLDSSDTVIVLDLPYKKDI